MPAIDFSKAAKEAAESLNIKDDETVIEEQPDDKEENGDLEKSESSVEKTGEEGETGEEEEAEEDELTSSKRPSKSAKTIPIDRFNEVYGKMKQMERALQWMALQQQQPKKEERHEEKPEPEPDWESLTNKELAQHLLKKLGRDVQGALRDTLAPVMQFVDNYTQKEADRQVGECAQKYSDYWDYADKMMELSNRHPSLNAEEVYRLAKGDKESVAKSVTKRIKDKMQLKRKANVEKRSSPSEKVSEDKEFKTIREAGLAAAKKLGIIQ